MFFGYRSLPGGQMVALGWTEERSFKCIHCTCTMKRYLSQRSVHLNRHLQKKEKKRAILAEYLLPANDTQKYSSDCFQISLNKPAGKKKKKIKIKQNIGFLLEIKRTCINLNVMQETTRYSKYWHRVNKTYSRLPLELHVRGHKQWHYCG